MSKFGNYDGMNVNGKISTQGAVVINCQLDNQGLNNRARVNGPRASNVSPGDYITHPLKASVSPDVCSIEIGDLVFCTHSAGQTRRGGILNQSIPVTSVVNGLYVRKRAGDKDGNNVVKHEIEARELNKLSETVRFMGVALNNANAFVNSADLVKGQVTVRTHGTASIRNTGADALAPGDTMLWEIPDKAGAEDVAKLLGTAGRSEPRGVLRTVPLSSYVQSRDKLDLRKTVKKALSGEKINEDTNCLVAGFATNLANLAKMFIVQGIRAGVDLEIEPTDDEDTKKVMTEFANSEDFHGAVTLALTAFVNIHVDLERRRIGKVFSESKPGQDVDVMLH
jgi:hypothetical protein